METIEPRGTRWQKVDLDFHSSVAAATHNVIAMHLMEALKDSFESYFRVKKYTTRPDRKGLLLRQHKAIFDAIRRRDSKAAREKVLEHLDYVEEVITEDLGKNR
jgi:GntR family transcriptional repressor for pyruvate dehydrogenase complex